MYYKTPLALVFSDRAMGNVWLYQNEKWKYLSLFLTNIFIFFSLAFSMNDIVIVYMNISNYFPHF